MKLTFRFDQSRDFDLSFPYTRVFSIDVNDYRIITWLERQIVCACLRATTTFDR